jgi:hypothetical protein
MKQINISNLEEGLLVTGYNPLGIEARLIRAGVHSVTNHNAMVVKHGSAWGIAEAVPPWSKISTIKHYEQIMSDGYIARFYRLRTLDVYEREQAARYFVTDLLGKRYPRKSKMVMLSFPLYNLFVDRTKLLPSIRLAWCSQLVKRAYLSVPGAEDCLDGYHGKKKELFTPKTFENRIIQGLFEDVTDLIVGDSRGE